MAHPSSATRIDLVLLAAIIGFLGGLLGALVVALFFMPGLSGNETRSSIVGGSIEEIKTDEVYSRVARSIVEWYPSARVAAGDGALTPADAVAFGAVVTSDGWLIGPPSVAKNDLVPVVDRTRLTIIKKIVDPWTGVVLVQTKATNLTVVSFRDASPSLGEATLAPLRGRGFGISTITSIRAPVLVLKMFTSNLSLSEDRDDGAPIFDRTGKMIGMVSGGDENRRALPIGHLAPLVRTVLRTGRATRPDLGVTTHDLSGTAIAGSQLRGAKVQTVRTRSGLLPGDLIESVNDKSIDNTHDLAELIMEYDSGTEVRLQIIRSGKSFTLLVTLGSQG